MQRDGNPIDKIESFALSIRNEALEQLAEMFESESCISHERGECIATRIRALKESP
jgi:hypothetical protein